MVRKSYHDTRTPTAVLSGDQKKEIPCKFLAAKGKCNKGDKCPFSHDTALVEQKREAQEAAKPEPKPEEVDDADKGNANDDEDEEVWTKEDEYGKKAMKDELDIKMFEVIDMIRRDDPKLYQEDAEFFDEPNDEDENKNEEEMEAANMEPLNAEELKRKKAQLINKFFVNRAHERSTKKSAHITDEDHEQMQQIQQDAKAAFKAATSKIGSEEENADFFKFHEPTAREEAMEEVEYQNFLQDQDKKQKEEEMEDAANLTRIFDNKGELTNDEKFLRDYLLNKGWVNPLDTEVLADAGLNGPTDMILTDEQIEEIEDQEEELKLLEEYQVKQAESHQQQIFTPAPDIVKQFSERRQRLTKRHKDRLRRNLRYKQQREEIDADLDKKKETKRKEIFDLVVELKELIKGDGSAVDKLVLKSPEKDFDKKIDTNKITQELFYSVPDDDNDDAAGENEEGGTSVAELRKCIKRAFDEYYKLFYQDMMLFTPVRFRYAKSEEKSNLSVADILMMDDEELDRIDPIRNLKTYDGEEAPELTKYIDHEVQRQYTTPNNFQWDGDFDSLKELAKKRKKAEKKKERKLLKEQGAVKPAVLSDEWNNAQDEEKPKKEFKKPVEQKPAPPKPVAAVPTEDKPVERKRKQNLFDWARDEEEQPARKKPRYDNNSGYNTQESSYNQEYKKEFKPRHETKPQQQQYNKPEKQEFKAPAPPAVAPKQQQQEQAPAAQAEAKKKTRRGTRGKKTKAAE